jgi:hypothetical protein
VPRSDIPLNIGISRKWNSGGHPSIQKMPPPSSVLQMRISLNGGNVSSPGRLDFAGNIKCSGNRSPPHAVAVMQHPVTSSVGRAAMNMPHVDASPTTM